jgi:hypothetical protein
LSAILKALKKIEQESSGKVRSPSVSRKLDAKKALNQRAKKSWLFRRLSYALGLATVLVAAIALGFAYGPSFLKGRPSPSNLSALSGDTGKEKRHSAPVQQRQSGVRSEKRAKNPETVNRSAQADPSVPLSPPRAQPLIPQEPIKARTAQGEIQPPPSGAEAQTPSETHPVLELQAVVWSDDPESRFAVINGHIVRANGMVEGVTVMEISQNAVSLKQGAKEWNIKMLEGH